MARTASAIFQFYNLLPVLTAERNVEVPLLLTNLSSRERKRNVQAALDLVGLADRAKHKPAELSGGQQQRVAIARALVADPTLLVCDEPTGDLDRETSESILELLQLLNRKQGKTIVMVTHDPRAADHASRRLYVDKGTLVEARRSSRGMNTYRWSGRAYGASGANCPHAVIRGVAFLLFGIMHGVAAGSTESSIR
jgi:putative ABC transport system ATP-binding protein